MCEPLDPSCHCERSGCQDLVGVSVAISVPGSSAGIASADLTGISLAMTVGKREGGE
jgi:hypothetical protein